MGSKEDVAARIEADTKVKIEEMNRAVAIHKDPVSLLTKFSETWVKIFEDSYVNVFF